MVHLLEDLGYSVEPDKNISGTSNTWIQDHAGGVNDCEKTARPRPGGACSFVVADWRDGGEPFCGAPTRAGSSYCERHEPICILARESAEGRSRAAALMEEVEAAPEPPPELAHLKESVLPESLPDDVGDLRALLDHPPPVPGTREPD